MASLERFFIIRVSPNYLLINALFDLDVDQNVRLVKVDNTNPTEIDCTYQVYQEAGNPVGLKPTSDEFTFPWSAITADVNLILLDTNGTVILPGDTMRTQDAPTL